MPSITLLRAGVAGAAVAALSLTGVAANPATAATAPKPAASISLHVTDSSGTPLENVAVGAMTATKYVNFGLTDDQGNVLKPRGGVGGSSKLTSGTWQFVIADNDPVRQDDGPMYAPTSFTTKLAAGATDLGAKTLYLASTVKGRLVAQSSQTPLSEVGVAVLPTGFDPADAQFGGGTNPDGTFDARYLSAGSYTVSYQAGKAYLPAKTFDIEEGSDIDLGDVGVQVKASTRTLSGKSAAKGQVTLTYVIDGLKYGPLDPRGSITVTSGGVKQSFEVTPLDNGKGKVVATVTGLKKGTRTLTVAYTGTGDLLSNTTTGSYVVK